MPLLSLSVLRLVGRALCATTPGSHEEGQPSLRGSLPTLAQPASLRNQEAAKEQPSASAAKNGPPGTCRGLTLQMAGLLEYRYLLGRCLRPQGQHGQSPSLAYVQGTAPTYLPDAFRRTGHAVVSSPVLADGPPELGKRAVLLQGVGALGAEVLIDGRIPDGAVRHLHLFGQVLECPEMQRSMGTCCQTCCRDLGGPRSPKGQCCGRHPPSSHRKPNSRSPSDPQQDLPGLRA